MSHELNYHKTHNLAKHTHSEFQLVQLIKSLVVKRYLGFNLSRPFFRLKTCNNIVLDKILKEIILTLNFIVVTHDNLIPSSIYIKKTTNGNLYSEMKILIDISYIQTTPFCCLCENKALLL